MPGNGICRDPGFKIFLVRRGHSHPRAPPLGIPEPTAESLRKAVENTESSFFSFRPDFLSALFLLRFLNSVKLIFDRDSVDRPIAFLAAIMRGIIHLCL